MGYRSNFRNIFDIERRNCAIVPHLPMNTGNLVVQGPRCHVYGEVSYLAVKVALFMSVGRSIID